MSKEKFTTAVVSNLIDIYYSHLIRNGDCKRASKRKALHEMYNYLKNRNELFCLETVIDYLSELYNKKYTFSTKKTKSYYILSFCDYLATKTYYNGIDVNILRKRNKELYKESKSDNTNTKKVEQRELKFTDNKVKTRREKDLKNKNINITNDNNIDVNRDKKETSKEELIKENKKDKDIIIENDTLIINKLEDDVLQNELLKYIEINNELLLLSDSYINLFDEELKLKELYSDTYQILSDKYENIKNAIKDKISELKIKLAMQKEIIDKIKKIINDK